MTCAACGHENRAGRKFCAECGTALALTCAACGAPNEPGEKFCGECGAGLVTGPARAAVAPPAPPHRPPRADADVRKVVTIVFADLVGSTALHERLDPESARLVMERYYAALRTAVDAHGGTVVKLLGDGVMAAFGLKRVAEDDALRAVRAAAAMQEAFRALAERDAALGAAGLRVAVNTGEVVVAAAQDDVVGDPVNVAARLQEQGRAGDVVLGEATRRLVATRVTLAPLGSVALKGRTEAVAAHRLVSLDPPAGAAAAPFVGREEELRRLEGVLDAAVTTPATRLAVLVGSPGLGKSRLIDELARRHGDDATILAAHCDAAGGATFAPLAQALRRFLGLADGAVGEPVRTAVAAVLGGAGDDGERARIAGGIDKLLGGSAMSPEETFFVVRRFLAALAVSQPVVLVIDDLHWGEPLLLDLVEHLVQWGSGVPLFVLVGARPELRELRSSLVTTGGVVADVVVLGGLDAGAAMRLAAGVIGAADLPAAVAAKVLATSEGNPLFVGELVRMLVQEGALAKDGDRWTVGANLAALEMPPTIHALLAARIERLGADDRTVLERAAVVGRHFSRSAVAALLGANGGTPGASDLDGRLESLRRSELIERDTGWLLGEPVLRFHHVLIRDAAYRRLLKGTRAELHARLADWIEGQVGDTPEHDEMVGWHLEQAHQLRHELGPLDAAGAVLGERAARRLAAAGRRALARDDVSLAAGLLGRATQRLGAAAPERADLVLDWCEALLAAGDVGPAADAIAELERVANDGADRIASDASGGVAGDASAVSNTASATAVIVRLRAWHACFAGQLTVLTAPEALHETAERVGAAARELAALDDAAGEAKAHFVHAQALARLGKIGACEAALDLALAAARRAGDRRRANAVLAGAPLAALWGPSPVTRASGRCLDVVRVLRITQGAPAVEAVALSCQGVLEALRGRTEAARRMLASSRTMVEELGISHRLFETEVLAGRIDLLEGDAAAAERALRAGYDGLRALGLGIDAARAAALLGRALLALDRAAEAETLSHESELLAGDDLQAAIAWRGVRAEALARRGDHAAATTFAEAAVAIAAATDALLDHADARLALAAALRAAGRGRDADAEERRAIELWEAKGATVLVERTRRMEAPVAAGDAASQPRPPTAVRRRITPNRASRALVAFNAAMAAPDFAAFRAQMHEDYEEIDHPTGASYGRDANVAALERLMRSRDASCQTELLATLGDALMLGRRRVHASATGGGRFDVGEYAQEAYSVAELGADGRWCRHEVFGADRLGHAIARLYERYAESMANGPEREQAAGRARAIGAALRSATLDEWSDGVADAFELVDHRVLGTGGLRGGEAMRANFRAMFELEDIAEVTVDDVLALSANGILFRGGNSGLGRASGGAYERRLLQLWSIGSDGRFDRAEFFDTDRDAEALARFDEVVGGGAPARPVRRVTPNAVTLGTEAFDAAFARGDAAAFADLLDPALVVVDHPTRSTYGRAGAVESFERLLGMEAPRVRHEPLATLGASLGLFRRSISAAGSKGGRFDVGAFEREELVVSGGAVIEIFAAERLGDAIVRLYERYAEGLSDAAASTRARGIARSLAAFDGPITFDGIAGANAPAVEVVDQRILGTWSARGREEWLTHWRGQLGLADDSAGRYEAVLALEPGAILVHQTFSGSSRSSGGAFENVMLVLHVFDAHGLIVRTELFDPAHVAAACARFDALTVDPAPRPPARRRVFPNAATRTASALEAAFARRDLAAVDALLGDPLETIEHPTATRYGRDGQLESSRRMMRMPDLEFRIEPLATLGEALGLFRRVVTASGTAGGRFDVGAYEIESIVLMAADAAGRITASEVFAADHLGPAIGRLHARYAESLPAGPERTRTEGVARTYAFWNDVIDPEGVPSVTAPSFVHVDHRSLGTWSAVGPDEWARHWRVQAELAEGFTRRDDDVLAFTPAVHLVRHTFLGTDRASGGPFENVVLAVQAFDADGRLVRAESWEPEQEAEALARFDALTAPAAPGPSLPRVARARRMPRGNRATTATLAFEAAVAARDPSAVASLFDTALTVVDHQNGATYGRDGHLDSIGRLLRARDPELRAEPLAALGEDLALWRRRIRASGTSGGRFDVGEFDREELVLFAVGSDGTVTAIEVFASTHLCQALARLYGRYAECLPDGPERARAAGTAAAHAVMSETLDADRIGDAFAESYVCVDHRSLGTWSAAGRDGWMRHWRAQGDLAASFSRRDEDVLAFTPAVNLMRHVYFGTSRASGGPFENVILCVNVFDADGRASRAEIFEPEQEEAALARFDALVAGDPSGATARCRVRANAATRSLARFAAVIAARDRDALGDVFAESLHFTHHPTGATYGRREMAATWRSILKAERVTFRSEILASLGETLALERHQLAIEGLSESHVAGFGLAEFDEIVVVETDERERWVRAELFDADHFGDAIARLYARQAELLPDGPLRGRAAMTARVTATMLTRSTEYRLEDVSAPDFQAVDHRTVGIGTATGAGFWQRWRDATDELAQDPPRAARGGRAALQCAGEQTYRIEDVLALSADGLLRRTTEMGTVRASGGTFENGVWILSIFGPDGRQSRIELFDVGREAEALARYDALIGRATEPATPAPATDPFANAATRALDRVAHVTTARDWDGLADTMAPSLRFDDRRPLFQMQLGKDGFLQQHRVLFDVPNARWVMTTIATRGERLTLSRILLQGEVDGGGGALEIDHLGVIEVDADARMTAIVLFEPGELDAASTELDARWQAGGASAHPRVAAYQGAFARALAERDWKALAALHAPTLVAHDHRLVGWDVLRGPEAYVGALRAMVDLAPDAQGRLDHLRTAERGFLAEVVWVGTRDGGAFESPFLWVVELDETGRAQRLYFYDPHHIDAARGRFAELEHSVLRAGAGRIAPGATVDHIAPQAAVDRTAPRTALRASPVTPEHPRDPLAALVKPTLVIAAMDAWRAAYDAGFETGRWEAMQALMAPDFVFDDRRRLVLLRGDVELMLASLRERAASGARAEWTIVGAAGERIAIGRMLWSGGPPDGRFEIEYLGVVEVDETGLVVANVLYDLADSRAARHDAWARWAAMDPAVVRWTDLVRRSEDGFDAKDREDMAERFSADLLVEDHRRTGLGRLEGFEAYSKSLEALWELAPDQRIETGWFWPAVEPHGIVTSLRRYGTLPDGGAFESDYLLLWIAPAGRITHAEYFEVDDLDRAVARLAELRPDPLRIPPNAATRAIDRRTAAFEARDWDALRDLCCGSLVFEDRRWIARTNGDREMFIASNRLVGDVGAHVARAVLATAGDRLALERARITAGEVGAEIEVDTLVVSQIDADERLVAIVFFDPGDRAAAFRELWHRHVALTRPSALPSLEALLSAGRDLSLLRAALPDDFYFHDHRRTGLGRLDGADAYVASVAALYELAPDAVVGAPLYFLADEPYGALAVGHSFGTLVDGGAYETVYAMIALYGPDGMIGAELFELEHLDAARARFETLRG